MAIHLPERVAKNIDQFSGREWLISEVYAWWVGRPETRYFLLTGGPGTGKSMITAWLAGYGPELNPAAAREQRALLSSAVRAVYFCRAETRNLSPKVCAESLANQLTNTVPGFAEALATTLEDRVHIVGSAQAGAADAGARVTGVAIDHLELSSLGDELSFDRAFSEPLRQLYENGYAEPMLLLIDALDEALGYRGDKSLPELFSTLADLPPQVRVLVTTRPDPRVLKFYRRVEPFDLIKQAPANVDDVRAFTLRRLAGAQQLGVERCEAFARRIAYQAKGIFLYASIVLDELLPRLPAALDLDRYRLPDGLSGLYHDFLTRELGKDEQKWFEVYEPLLGTIAVAQGDGLSTEQLSSIIGRDTRSALRASMQYLSGDLPDGPFKPFHKSFSDFLFEDEDNVDYHIDASAMHRRIARCFLERCGEDWDECTDVYAIHYLPAHLVAGLQDDEYRQQLISQLDGLLADLCYLEKKVAGFGIFSLLEDIASADTGLKRAATRDSALFRLRTVFDNESHHLDGWVKSDRPGYFLQQVLYQAKRLGFSEIAQRAAEVLSQRGLSYLREEWSSGRPSEALLRTLAGHQGAVWSLCISADGARILSAGSDGLVRAWNFETGKEEQLFGNHRGRVRAVTILSDGKTAVSAGADGGIHLWDIASGKELVVLAPHCCEVLSLATIPNAPQRLVSGDAKGFIRIWDLRDETYREIKAHSGEVRALRVMSDGARLVSASADRRVRLWDIQSGSLLETLQGGGPTFRAVVASTDLTRVYAAASDGTIKVWRLTDASADGFRRSVGAYERHRGRVRCVAESDDRQYLISGGEDRVLKVWSAAALESQQPLHVLQGHSGTVWAVEPVPGTSFIVSASDDGAIRVWDLDRAMAARGKAQGERAVPNGHGCRVKAIVADRDAHTVISGAQDGTIKHWRISAVPDEGGSYGVEVSDMGKHAKAITDLTFATDARRVFSGSLDKTARAWNLDSPGEPVAFSGHGAGITRVAYLSDKQYMLSASNDGTLIVWDTDYQKKIVFARHRGPVLAMAVHVPSETVLSGGVDGFVMRWDATEHGMADRTQSGPASAVHKHMKAVLDLAIAPSGRHAISASADGSLVVWNLEQRNAAQSAMPSLRAVYQLIGHEGPVLGVAITPDGRRAVSVSSDNTLRMWDLPEAGMPGQELQYRRCLQKAEVGRPTRVCISADGKKAVTIGENGRLDVWDIGGDVGRAAGQAINLASLSLPHETTCLWLTSQPRVVVGDQRGDVSCFAIVDT